MDLIRLDRSEGRSVPRRKFGHEQTCRLRCAMSAIRGRPEVNVGAPGQKSGCDAYSPRDGRASVWHAEDADGGDALSDEDAAQGGDRDGVARARLQLNVGDDQLRY